MAATMMMMMNGMKRGSGSMPVPGHGYGGYGGGYAGDGGGSGDAPLGQSEEPQTHHLSSPYHSHSYPSIDLSSSYPSGYPYPNYHPASSRGWDAVPSAYASAAPVPATHIATGAGGSSTSSSGTSTGGVLELPGLRPPGSMLGGRGLGRSGLGLGLGVERGASTGTGMGTGGGIGMGTATTPTATAAPEEYNTMAALENLLPGFITKEDPHAMRPAPPPSSSRSPPSLPSSEYPLGRRGPFMGSSCRKIVRKNYDDISDEPESGGQRSSRNRGSVGSGRSNPSFGGVDTNTSAPVHAPIQAPVQAQAGPDDAAWYQPRGSIRPAALTSPPEICGGTQDRS